MTPEQLWEKYCKPEMIDNHFYDVMREKDFLAALKEYGDYRAEETRKRAVSVCNDMAYPDRKPPYRVAPGREYFKYCAAAIEKMDIN